MLSKTRVTLPKLISYINSFTITESNKIINKKITIFPLQIKSNDNFKFKCLDTNKSQNINDFPEKLKLIFDPFIKDIIRFGSNKNYDNDNNLSLYFSILFLLINDFDKLPDKDQQNAIIKLRDKLIIFISIHDNLKNQHYNEFGWSKKDIIDTLIKFETNKLIIKILADYFNINIFILNIVEDKIYVVSENNFYDMFRPNILISVNYEIFEPLIYSNSKLIEYNSGLIKKLITVDKNNLILINFSLKNQQIIKFEISLSNIQKYNKNNIKTDLIETKLEPDVNNIELIKTENVTKLQPVLSEIEIENDYEEILQSDANVYIKDIEKPKKNILCEKSSLSQLNFKISPKMKLDELQHIATKLNIVLKKENNNKSNKSNKSKTKTELINEINSILKNN